MPNIPDIDPQISIDRDDAINIIIASIAMEELALAHILNAEGEKLQYVLGTLEGRDPGEITICDVMSVNNSVQKTLKNVIKAEMLLQLKLENVLEFSDEEACGLTIRGEKIWRDGNNISQSRPEFVEIRLLRDGELYKTTTLDSLGDCTYTFSCLPIWKDSENKYVYRVDETAVPPGYTKTIRGFDVINTILPGSITIEGTKTWVDEDDAGGTRPDEITVNLLQNGVQFLSDTIPIPPDTNTVPFNFANVPQFDDEGGLFIYTVDEVEVPDYKKSIDGFNITNTLEITP